MKEPVLRQFDPIEPPRSEAERLKAAREFVALVASALAVMSQIAHLWR
jgi:hypothetical protein